MEKKEEKQKKESGGSTLLGFVAGAVVAGAAYLAYKAFESDTTKATSQIIKDEKPKPDQVTEFHLKPENSSTTEEIEVLVCPIT